MKPELRNPDGTFVKGVSPNPGGQSKRLRKVRRALEKLDEPALKRLRELIETGDDKTAAVALGIWAKYRLPVPKEGKGDAPGAVPRVPMRPEVARAIARVQ